MGNPQYLGDGRSSVRTGVTGGADHQALEGQTALGYLIVEVWWFSKLVKGWRDECITFHGLVEVLGR